MSRLSDFDVSEFNFFLGDCISLIMIGRYEIRLQFESLSLITVYSEIHYFIPSGRSWRIPAEGSKRHCEFTDVLGNQVDAVSFDEPNLFSLGFADKSILKIDASAEGYEAFLVNRPEGALYVFS